MNYPKTMKEYNDGKKRMLPIVVNWFLGVWFTISGFIRVGKRQERNEGYYLTTPEHRFPFHPDRPMHATIEGGHNFFDWRDRVTGWLNAEVKAGRLVTEMKLVDSRWCRCYRKV